MSVPATVDVGGVGAAEAESDADAELEAVEKKVMVGCRLQPTGSRACISSKSSSCCWAGGRGMVSLWQ